MSVVPWDASDDMPVSQLLSTACWGAEQLNRCRVAYEVATATAPERGVMALLEELGVQPAWLARRYQRAIFRRGPSSSLDELLIGLVALDPTTAHGGVWNGLRAQYIFRTYDADEDGLLAPPELATLLSDVRRAYGNPPLPAHEALAEAVDLIADLEAAGGSAPALSLSSFRAAVGQLRVRGCSRLFRCDTPLFRDDVPSPLAPGSVAPPPACPAPAFAAATAEAHPAAPPASRLDPWSSATAAAPPAAFQSSAGAALERW